MIKESGGIAIVQNPETAEIATMPKAALAATEVDFTLELGDMAALLSRQNLLHKEKQYGAIS